MKIARTLVLLAGLALVLGMINLGIWQKEEVLAGGRLVLLELRPVDPRSLMQGDYMRLRYARDTYPDKATIAALEPRGTLVLKLDENAVATYARRDDGSALVGGEVRIAYKFGRSRGVTYGAQSFFFQEGDSELYDEAKYGVLKVDDSGESVLVGLADENRVLIEKPEG